MSRVAWIVRRVLGTVGGRTLVTLLVLVVAYQMWIAFGALGKVADGVGEGADLRGRFAVDVVLGFPPERFHILDLQEYGRVRGTTGNVLHLHLVTQDGVDAIARKYWIEEIRPGTPLSMQR